MAPGCPAASSFKPGNEFRVECRECTDSQIVNSDDFNDVRDVNLAPCHMLSGPVEIDGAEPGDLLVVDILDLGPVTPPNDEGPAPGQGWGYTGIFAKVNGGGFLTDHYPDAYKAIWDFRGQEATSRHIPGVRYRRPNCSAWPTRPACRSRYATSPPRHQQVEQD